MAKPFFFKIIAADLLNFATDPEGEGMTLLRFAKELQKGESDISFIQDVIGEAKNYSQSKQLAGRLGGIARASNAKANPSSAKAEVSAPQAISSNSNRNISINSTEDKPKDKPLRFSAMSLLKDKGVDDELAKDWLSVRKTKKATNSKTAFNSIENQVEKSGKTWNEIAKLCCEKSWSGFNAEWLENVKGENYGKGTNNSKLDIKTGDDINWTEGF
jgi:hypothetical protein